MPEFDPQYAVREFHSVFGLHVESEPALPPEQIRYERARLIAEEAAEAISALLAGTPPWISHDICSVFINRMERRPQPVTVAEIAAELADLAYVTYGGAVNAGVPLDVILAEIHRANMRKLGPNGRPIIDAHGKPRKPEGWQPPDIARVISR